MSSNGLADEVTLHTEARRLAATLRQMCDTVHERAIQKKFSVGGAAVDTRDLWEGHKAEDLLPRPLFGYERAMALMAARRALDYRALQLDALTNATQFLKDAACSLEFYDRQRLAPPTPRALEELWQAHTYLAQARHHAYGWTEISLFSTPLKLIARLELISGPTTAWKSVTGTINTEIQAVELTHLRKERSDNS
jgi:hypothetical protein